MFKTNLIIAFRHLRRNTVFSFVNVLGLSAAVAAGMLIARYAWFELSFDSFHTDAQNIFRVETTVSLEDEIITRESSTYYGIIEALGNDYPEVQGLTVISPFSSDRSFLRIRSSDDALVPLTGFKGLYADSSFFSVFSFPMVSGSAAEALRKPYSAVLSRALAEKYFANSAIGRVLEFTDDDGVAKLVTVQGVMEDVPSNSHVKFDVVVNVPEGNAHFWEWHGYAYVRLRESTRHVEIAKRLNALAVEKNGLKSDADDYGRVSTFALKPLRDIHLHSNSDSEFEPGADPIFLYALMIFTVLVLIIGWINYINLSTAICLERSRQIAIRKVIGASRRMVALQLLTESALLNGAVVALACSLSWSFRAAFADMVGVGQSSLDFESFGLWIGITIFFVFSTLVTGIYPMMAVVNARTVTALKGKVQARGNFAIGNPLLFFQFTAATILIIATIAAYVQLNFMQHRDLGMDIDQVLVVKGLNFDRETWSDTAGGYVVDKAYERMAYAFSDALRDVDGVVNVTALSHLPGQLPEWGSEFKVPDLDPSKAFRLKGIGVDHHFISTLGIHLVAGRDFSRDHPSDRGNELRRAVIINETASRMLGFGSPQEAVSRHIFSYWGADYEIIGVVKSFHQRSPKEQITPLYFMLQPRALPYFAIDLHTEDVSGAMAGVRSTWKRYFPDHPFEHLFLDDFFNKQYHNEIRFGKMTVVFAFLAIALGCMGLFAMTAHAVVQRTKEIGIRKVMGATAANVVAIFSAGFLKLIVAANIFAIPLAYYGISAWLDSYAYKEFPAWWIFLVPFGVLMVLAAATIGAQTIRVATMNPADILKSE